MRFCARLPWSDPRASSLPPAHGDAASGYWRREAVEHRRHDRLVAVQAGAVEQRRGRERLVPPSPQDGQWNTVSTKPARSRDSVTSAMTSEASASPAPAPGRSGSVAPGRSRRPRRSPRSGPRGAGCGCRPGRARRRAPTSTAQTPMPTWNACTEAVTDSGTPGMTSSVSPTSRPPMSFGVDGGDDGADRGDAQQAGDARDRVVDAGGDAGVVLVGVGQHGRGQRRDRRDQAEREDQQRREQLGPVVDVLRPGAASARCRPRSPAARSP